jgi:hypothetical protein
MSRSITSCGSGKKNLVLAAVAAVALIPAWRADGQASTSWTGFAGNVWTRARSWNSGQPVAGGIAVFGSSGGGTIALRESGSPGSVDVGTILVTSTSFPGFVTGASSASINLAPAAAQGHEF